MPIERPFGGTNIVISRVVGAGAGVATPIGMISTKEKTLTNQFDDATVPDPATPGEPVQQQSYKKMTAHGVSISGVCGPVEFRLLEEDARSPDPVRYRFAIELPLARGGGYWDGLVHFDNLNMTSGDNGVARWTSQLRVEGDMPWTDAAA